MSIGEQQLSTWSNTGADSGSKKTYDRVKNIIDGSTFSKKSEVDIFLQGSYANTTHVRADSDVDVVIKLKTVWNSDKSKLSDAEKQEYEKATSNATYGHDELRNELITIFRNELGAANVDASKKCIKLKLGDSYLNADVIPCLSYRIYRSFSSTKQDDYIEGIAIKKTDGKMIHNFPKHHINNGVKKHQNTDEYYKKVVRILKNMRNKLIADGSISEGVAPSYFIECLTYNIPNVNFGSSLQSSVLNTLKWFSENHNKFDGLTCQNEVTKLFGSDETQWNIAHCQTFTNATIKLWNGS